MTDRAKPLAPLAGAGTLKLDRTSWHRGEYEVRRGDDVVARIDYALSGRAVCETAAGRWHLGHPQETLGVAVVDAASGAEVAVLDFQDWSRGGTARLGDASYEMVVEGVLHPRFRVRRDDVELVTLTRPHLLGADADIELSAEAADDPGTAMLVLIAVHAMISQQKDAGRS